MRKPKSLKAILITPFSLLIVLVIGLVALVSFLHGQRAVENLVQPLLTEINAHSEHQLRSFFGVPLHINQMNAQAIQREWVDVSDQPFMAEFFATELHLFPSVTSIYFGNPQGGLANAGREGAEGYPYIIITEDFQKGEFRKYAIDKDGQPSRLLLTVPFFDATTRPWYRAAVEKEGPVWNEPYLLATEQEMAIAMSMAVRDPQGHLMGVVSVDLFLSHIEHFLASAQLGPTGESFLMDGQGQLIATSISEPIVIRSTENGVLQRLKASESTSPLIRGSSQEVFGIIEEDPALLKQPLIIRHIQRQRHFIQVHPVVLGDAHDWLLVTVIPESAFMEQIHQNNWLTLVLSVIALLIAAVVGVWTSRKIAFPIAELEASTREIANGKWPQPNVQSGIREIQQLNRSFHLMSQTLEKTVHALNQEVKLHEEAEEKLKMQKQEIEVSNEELQAMTEEVEATNEQLQASMEQLEANNRLLVESEQVLKTREKELKESETRARRQRSGLVTLFLEESIANGDLPKAVNCLTEVLAQTLQAERTSIWFIDEEKNELQCVDLYQSSKDKHTSGMSLPIDGFSAYFDALRHDGRIYAEDAQHDPRTYELAEGYLIPLGITSMLEASIQLRGKLVGVVCSEHVGKKRRWFMDEEAFAATVATIMSQVLTIVENRQTETEKSRFSAIMESSSDFVSIADTNQHLVYINAQGRKLIGLHDHEEISGKTISELHPPEINTLIQQTGLPTALREGVWTGETALVHVDGHEIPVSQIILCHRDSTGQVEFFSTIIKDISDLMAYQQEMNYSHYHDRLTGLFNRECFEEELKRMEGRQVHPMTIFSIDVDGLKLVNDTFGHEQGNEMLEACAKILKESFREQETVARVGGDEFAVILPFTDETVAQQIQERIFNKTDQFNKTHQGLPLSISIGMAHASQPQESLEDLFKESESAMMRNKLNKGMSARSHIIQALMAALGERDFITQGHGLRLSDISQKIALAIGLSSAQVDTLRLLSQVHDLGKVGIPDQILFKPGPLTEEEWETMRLHPEKGYRIAASSADLAGIADFILKHHEKWDGSGYPLGLEGEEIPIECRILSIADAYDAMTSDRPYRHALTESQAIAEIKKGAGTQFDPELVRVFLDLFDGSERG